MIHGGGNEVERWSRRLGLEPRTHDGLRVTDPETLEVAIAVLGGLVNTQLVAALTSAGRSAVGLTGADAGLLRVRRRDPQLGEVGEVTGADPAILEALIAAGQLPVVASIGLDDAGSLLNVNADEAAGAIAAARGGVLLLCTDVAGVQLDGRCCSAWAWWTPSACWTTGRPAPACGPSCAPRWWPRAPAARCESSTAAPLRTSRGRWRAPTRARW